MSRKTYARHATQQFHHVFPEQPLHVLHLAEGPITCRKLINARYYVTAPWQPVTMATCHHGNLSPWQPVTMATTRPDDQADHDCSRLRDTLATLQAEVVGE
ncbi:hypothetical protein Bbelb_074930 [Branchiostoma belcheri]|nr:hypothetical protein Bbelb_074930 [Branchiostoma belcheri]